MRWFFLISITTSYLIGVIMMWCLVFKQLYFYTDYSNRMIGATIQTGDVVGWAISSIIFTIAGGIFLMCAYILTD